MQLQVLASGSQGNATLVRAGETHLLIDCGLPLAELDLRFRAARYEPRGNLTHILVSHGHLDHARCAGLLSRRTGATVHCAERLMQNRSIRRAKRIATLPIGPATSLGSGPSGARDPVTVRAVPLPHDAVPTVAFRLEHAGRVAVVATDLGHPSPTPAVGLRGAHVLVLEFNHEPELLRSGPYRPALKRRVASDLGHLSNAQAARMLALLAGPELHTLVLAHLSQPNNRPLFALAAAREALESLGLGHVDCVVASQATIGPALTV